MSTLTLTQHLASTIRATGPLSLHAFMRDVLTHPVGGYYMARTAIGRTGDFVTSPEVSQVFGEMIGVWTTYRLTQTKPKEINLVEFGPGRGTLMSDMLRTMRTFPDVYRTISAVHLIEASPAMKERQREAICGKDNQNSSTPDGIPVVWHASLDTVPSACPSFFLAHEFFDALPAHRFQYVIPGANEAANVAGNEAMTSSVTSPSTSSSASTSAQSASLSTQSASLSAQSAPEPFWNEIMVDLVRHESGSETDRDAPRFRLVRSRGPTLSSRTLTRLVDLAALAQSLGGKDGGKVGGNEAVLRDGTQVEVAPGAAAVAGMIGERVGRDGGAALIVDYGEDHPLQDSLRAIRDHRLLADPLSDIGLADLSVDVDFSLLRRSLSPHHVDIYGPIMQGDFLDGLGVGHRVERLVRGMAREKAMGVVGDVDRLRNKEKMGGKYKVMAVVKKGEEPVVPFGDKR